MPKLIWDTAIYPIITCIVYDPFFTPFWLSVLLIWLVLFRWIMRRVKWMDQKLLSVWSRRIHPVLPAVELWHAQRMMCWRALFLAPGEAMGRHIDKYRGKQIHNYVIKPVWICRRVHKGWIGWPDVYFDRERNESLCADWNQTLIVYWAMFIFHMMLSESFMMDVIYKPKP